MNTQKDFGDFMTSQLIHIFNHFVDDDIKSIKRLNSGHINDTFLIKTNLKNQYVLQKFNSLAFKEVESVINNKIIVSEFLNANNMASHYKSLTFKISNSGKYFYKESNGNYWNMTSYIPDSVVHDFATNSKMVCEAGKLYGYFISQTALLSVAKLKITLPDFHNVPFRFIEFQNALLKASEETKKKAKDLIDFAFKFKTEMFKLSLLEAKKTFPIRITHNDAKLSNILFDKKFNGIAVIDLDTVMPGIMLHDFGDSIRSICANAPEDSQNYDALAINLDYYQAFCEGHAESTAGTLTIEEIKYLPLAAKTITFIMGLRLLTDYLNNNVYYKVDYQEHNLVRAKNQFKLVENIQLNIETITNITYNIYGLGK